MRENQCVLVCVCDRARACVSVCDSVCDSVYEFVLACARKDRLTVIKDFVYCFCFRKGMFYIYMFNDAYGLHPC